MLIADGKGSISLGNTVKAGNLVIGEGLPKICVPITGKNREEILGSARAAAQVPADMAEWRADWYESAGSPEDVSGILSMIRGVLGEMPLLMTFRTAIEGGEQEADTESYQKLCSDAIRSGYIDLIDVELSSGEDTVRKLIAEARACGVRVIASSHDFEHTPDKNELIRRLLEMKELGADILKIAVMPQNRRDVAVLLEVSAEAADRLDRPVIAVSMGKLGMISRIACEAFGSSVTFAAASQASAPGQPGAAELREMLIRLHDSLSETGADGTDAGTVPCDAGA